MAQAEDGKSFRAQDSELHACLTTLVVCERWRMNKRVHVLSAKCAGDGGILPPGFQVTRGHFSETEGPKADRLTEDNETWRAAARAHSEISICVN